MQPVNCKNTIFFSLFHGFIISNPEKPYMFCCPEKVNVERIKKKNNYLVGKQTQLKIHSKLGSTDTIVSVI
jgi:hypothetical protein